MGINERLKIKSVGINVRQRKDMWVIEYEIAAPTFGRLAMTGREVTIAGGFVKSSLLAKASP